MILCVNTNAVKTSVSVQKDVDLEDIINNHTKYFDTEEQALESHYVPIDFCVTVRSIYSNLVLQTDIEGAKRYYTNLKHIQPFVHKGYDLIMYLTSIGLMHNVDYAVGFDDLMMKHSQFSPIGLYNPEPSILNPIIYSHIIISDEGAEDLVKYLKSDRKLVNINEMLSDRDGNIPALIETIIEVKEKQEDEQCDND